MALLLIDHIVYGVHGVIVVMRVAPQILAIENMSVDSDQVFMFATASAVGSLLLPDILLGLLAFRLTRLTACDRPSRRLKDCR